MRRRGFSLGVDLGSSHTGLALSKGFSPRPLSVLELRGHKLELRLIEIADKKEVDEFIIGLPRSHDGKETPQSNKVRSIAGRFAVRAADKEEVDEFIIGLPKSHDGKETAQSNKVRSIAGRFAVRAADRGLTVYLQDEHGSSLEALDYMIEIVCTDYAGIAELESNQVVLLMRANEACWYLHFTTRYMLRMKLK